MSDPKNLSRRQLLQAAGGVTLLTLVPKIVHGETERASRVYEIPSAGSDLKRPPVFTALPYLQPGPKSSKLVDGEEEIVIAWQTDNHLAEFTVLYGSDYEHKAEITSITRFPHSKGDDEMRINYAAKLPGLALSRKYRYRVTMDGATLVEGYFSTRKKRGQKTRFVSFGDNSYGDISDRAVAYQAFRAMPDFVMNTGDNVYESGLDDEYARYFFPIYNADQAGSRIGAPLLRAVPFYTVMANHDVSDKDNVHGAIANFTKHPGSLAYYTHMHLPLNGPVVGQPTPTTGDVGNIDLFKQASGDRFPTMGNYSFDYGDAHFLCLDSNVYVDPTDPALQSWVESDLSATDAPWKFVVYHHPAYNVGMEHFHEQHMRVLSPTFEKHGVAIVFSGHEHNYQRTKPIKFDPIDVSEAKQIGGKTRLVPGRFTIDNDYDGAKNRKPNGVIYLTTGAGGKHLYDAEMNQNPKNWVHEEDDNVAYVEKVVSDRHSITVIDMDAKTLEVRQVDQWGNEVDHYRLEL
jgi:hypothetical protein